MLTTRELLLFSEYFMWIITRKLSYSNVKINIASRLILSL
ncbi:hypothetical protein BACI71_110063 [Bacillus mycoides]|uniref:Uncharacterized protein n=1 Tax=Bacillus mycoides TaxID=1405 RepID=A0A653PBV8_BACMY|nr:hypothetical protein BACI71_110063 [Bacillus mycoides]